METGRSCLGDACARSEWLFLWDPLTLAMPFLLQSFFSRSLEMPSQSAHDGIVRPEPCPVLVSICFSIFSKFFSSILMMVKREAQLSALFSTEAMLHSAADNLISLVVARLRGSVAQSRFSDRATYFMNNFPHRMK